MRTGAPCRGIVRLAVMAVGAAVLLAAVPGCGTRQVVEHPYAEVAAAARERFVRIYPGGYFATRADVTEDPEKPCLDIVFHEFINYGQVIETEIAIVGLDDRRTRLEAKVVQFHRNWFFRQRREKWEEALLAVFAERLRTGEWPPFPWMEKQASGGVAPANH